MFIIFITLFESTPLASIFYEQTKWAKMENNTTTTEQFSSAINLNEESQLQYWKQYFNVTSGRLRKAVKEAGPTLDDIQHYLRSCMFS